MISFISRVVPVIFLISFSSVSIWKIRAQNLEAMSKSELRDQFVLLKHNLDSITIEFGRTSEERDQLAVRYNELESDFKNSEFEIAKIVQSTSDAKITHEQQLREKDREIEGLTRAIRSLEDSLIISKDKMHNEQERDVSSNDFLNRFFIDQSPLNNSDFSLVLERVVYQSENNGESNHSNYYGDGGLEKGPIRGVPELLDVDELQFWTVEAGLTSGGKGFQDYLILSSLDSFDIRLPRIGVIKNKLLTLQYPNGTEESFILSLQKYAPEVDNNWRGFLSMNLTSENISVNNSFTEARTGDVNWTFFMIEDECYMALSAMQLFRLGVCSPKSGDLLYSSGGADYYQVGDFYRHSSEITIPWDIRSFYYSRKGVHASEETPLIHPEDLVFLFKWK
jgi:hypothetical protein